MAWIHGLLAGTDSAALQPLYLATGVAVLGAVAYRYWAARKGRPTFSTSLPERAGASAATTREPAVRTVPVETPAHMEEPA